MEIKPFCPHCTNSDPRLLELIRTGCWFCVVCTKFFVVQK